jgi:hypothetical protein
VNSYGPRRCGRGSYVFTDVAALRPWIDKTVDALTRSDWTGRGAQPGGAAAAAEEQEGAGPVLCCRGVSGGRWEQGSLAGQARQRQACRCPAGCACRLATADHEQLALLPHAQVRALWAFPIAAAVWGDPNVLGFDGSRFQTTTPAGRNLTILKATGTRLSLVAELARHTTQVCLHPEARAVLKQPPTPLQRSGGALPPGFTARSYKCRPSWVAGPSLPHPIPPIPGDTHWH